MNDLLRRVRKHATTGYIAYMSMGIRAARAQTIFDRQRHYGHDQRGRGLDGATLEEFSRKRKKIGKRARRAKQALALMEARK